MYETGADEIPASFLADSRSYWNPARVDAWREMGIPLVIDKRSGYLIYDLSGHRLIDCHLNGGTFNFGHLNPELVDVLKEGLDTVDIGNHHFPAVLRTAFARALIESCSFPMQFAVFASGGSEAVDVAIKSARRATGRRVILSLDSAYHGQTGLSLNATADGRASAFLSDVPADFRHLPFNDLAAMEDELAREDVAAVILETIPATAGFPLPEPGYLPAVKRLCERYGAKYIADEVQTGLLRTGETWGVETFGVEPDIMVTAKGLGGGLYPVAAALLDARSGAWLEEDGWGHVSTGGGSELGCVVGLRVLEIVGRPEVRRQGLEVATRLRSGLDSIAAEAPDFLRGIRQCGLVLGLEFPPPDGARRVMRSLYEEGVWAIFSGFDPRILQFKPGLLMDDSLVDDLLERMRSALRRARAAAPASGLDTS